MQEHPKQEKKRTCCKVCKIACGFIGGIIFAVILFLVINVSMEQVSSSEYCGTQCHEMQTAYDSWKLTAHATNARGLSSGCVDCHLPTKDKYFTHLTAKAFAGAKDLYLHHFGPDYNSEEIKEKVLGKFENENCIHCHKNLLAKPSSETAKDVHAESLNPSDPQDVFRCVDCHEDAGHIR